MVAYVPERDPYEECSAVLPSFTGWLTVIVAIAPMVTHGYS